MLRRYLYDKNHSAECYNAHYVIMASDILWNDTLPSVIQLSVKLVDTRLSVIMLKVAAPNQGTLTEGEGSVQLTSSLSQLVL